MFSEDGYSVVPGVYSATEVEVLLAALARVGLDGRFGVRAVLRDYPLLQDLVFTPRLLQLVSSVDPDLTSCIKSIYFDKPPTANWPVNWHQDLTLNVRGRVEVPGFKNWRELPERTVVQPPREVLENILTVRIHLDDAHAANGALRVVPGSHLGGVVSIKNWMKDGPEEEVICEVSAGGVQLMRPLLLHASKRSSAARRRVLHLEFSGYHLPSGLTWWEALHQVGSVADYTVVKYSR